MDTRTELDPGVKNLADSFASSLPKSSIVSVSLKELPQLLETFHEKRNNEIRPQFLQVDKIGCNELDQY